MKKHWKDIVAGAWLCVMLLMVGGCLFRKPARVSGQSAHLVQKATEAVSLFDPVMMYYAAGLAVILIGVAVLAFGGKATGGILIVCGAGVSYFGQTLILRPWLSLTAVLATGVILAFIAYDRWKTRKALDETVVVVQNHPELKSEVGGGDAKIQERIRPVINSVKSKLRQAGRIA